MIVVTAFKVHSGDYIHVHWAAYIQAMVQIATAGGAERVCVRVRIQNESERCYINRAEGKPGKGTAHKGPHNK